MCIVSIHVYMFTVNRCTFVQYTEVKEYSTQVYSNKNVQYTGVQYMCTNVQYTGVQNVPSLKTKQISV